MKIQFRTAESDDVESVVQVLKRSRQEYLPYLKSPHTLEEDRCWVREALIPTGRVVLADADDVCVGVLATSIAEEIGWIDQLYLAPGYVGRGIGTSLLMHALGVLPRPIRLWAFQQNGRALRFYKHHGFVATKYTDGTDNEEKCPDVLLELSGAE